MVAYCLNLMKISHINFSDYSGGASRAAFRIAFFQKKFGEEVSLIVNHQVTSEVWVKKSKLNQLDFLRRVLEKIASFIILKKYRSLVSINCIPNTQTVKLINESDSDVVNLHWICCGTLGISDLQKISSPLVWTLHDMWPFMGVQHYLIDQLSLSGIRCYLLNFIEERIIRLKMRSWKNINLTIVCPSSWLANLAKESQLFKKYKVYVIPNAIDIDLFRPMPQDQVRLKHGLPQDKRIVLFGAANATMDERKGYRELKQALSQISNEYRKNLELLIFGSSETGITSIEGFRVHRVGNINDEHLLAEIYNCADVMVVPSLQENLANTIVESLACGVPVVAFNNGGTPDAIEHMKTGYLAAPFSSEGLAEGVIWTIKNLEAQELRQNSRRKALEYFSPDVVIRKYLELYNSIKETND